MPETQARDDNDEQWQVNEDDVARYRVLLLLITSDHYYCIVSIGARPGQYCDVMDIPPMGSKSQVRDTMRYIVYRAAVIIQFGPSRATLSQCGSTITVVTQWW